MDPPPYPHPQQENQPPTLPLFPSLAPPKRPTSSTSSPRALRPLKLEEILHAQGVSPAKARRTPARGRSRLNAGQGELEELVRSAQMEAEEERKANVPESPLQAARRANGVPASLLSSPPRASASASASASPYPCSTPLRTSPSTPRRARVSPHPHTPTDPLSLAILAAAAAGSKSPSPPSRIRKEREKASARAPTLTRLPGIASSPGPARTRRRVGGGEEDDAEDMVGEGARRLLFRRKSFAGLR